MSAKSKRKKNNKYKGIVIKRIVTASLLILVGVSIVALVGKGKGGEQAEVKKGARISVSKAESKVIAYYFHGTHRCWSCNTIESYSRESIETNFNKQLENGKLEFISLDVEQEENRHFMQKYNMASKMLVLVLIKDGKEIKYESMQDVWKLLRDKPAFLEYVKQGIKKYLDEV